MQAGVEYNKYLIKKYSFWSVYIHENQNYLGRVYIWCNREEALDLLDMTLEEEKEFFETARELKKVLQKLFQPDLLNYAALGNITQHLHVHIIPRYAAPRIFEHVIFNDKDWGHNYKTDRDFKIEHFLLDKIKDTIKKELDA